MSMFPSALPSLSLFQCVDNPALQKIRAAVGAPSTRLLAPDEVIEGAAKAGLLQNVSRRPRQLKQDDPEPPADQMDEQDDDNMDDMPPPPPPAFVAAPFPRPMGFTTGKGNQLNIQLSAKNRDRLAHLFDGTDDPAAATSAASAAAGPPPPPLPSGAAASMGGFSTGMGKRCAAMLEDDDRSNGRMSMEMGSDSRPSRPPPLPPPLPAPLPPPPAVGRPPVLGGFTEGGGFKPVGVSDAAMAKVKAIFDDDDDDDNNGNGSSPLPLPAPALPKQAPPQPLSAPRAALRPPQIRPLGVRPLHRPPMMRGRGGRGTKPFRPPFARGGLHSRVATAPPGAGAGRGVGVSRLTDQTDNTEGEGEGDGNGDQGEGVEEDMQMGR